MKVSLEKFREAWIKEIGKPKSEKDEKFLDRGIKDFYEDYYFYNVSLGEYFLKIKEE